MPALYVTVNRGGQRFLELLTYASWGVDVNPSPGPAHITGEGSRCGLRVIDQPYPNFLLELTLALKMKEQRIRTQNSGGRGPQSFHTHQCLHKCF